MNLIGPAGKLLAKFKNIQLANIEKPVKFLFYGPPGCGKTTLANILAEMICGSKWNIESINGRNVTIEVVRDWQHTIHSSSMFGDWKVIIINEADTMTKPAQDLMLSVLDELPDKRAVICTSNLNLSQMEERFHTRFGKHKIESPTDEEIGQLLCDRGLPADQAGVLAVTSCGNVRAACLDAEAWLSERKHAQTSSATQLISLELMGI